MQKQQHPKFGIYNTSADIDYFRWLWEEEVSSARRTLATEILDIADDIAYAVHDFEDGAWSGRIPLYALVRQQEPEITVLATKVMQRDERRLFRNSGVVFDALENLLNPLLSQARSVRRDVRLDRAAERFWFERPFDRSKDSRAYLKNFCSYLIGVFIDDVTTDEAFSEPSDDTRRMLDVLMGMAWVWMIERSDLETRRFAQRRVITELFDGYWERPEMLPQQSEWREIAANPPSDAEQWSEKARLICDHIAAMTDLYASGVHAEMYDATQTLTLQM